MVAKYKKTTRTPKPPIGNRFALGFGRPPELISDEDLIKLGKEMQDWIFSEEFSKAVSLSDFYIMKKKMSKYEWDCIVKRACFVSYYEQAKLAMAAQITRNKDMQQSYGNRYLGMYDRDLHDYEAAKLDRQTQREIEAKKALAAETQAPAHELLTAIFERLMPPKEKPQIEASEDKS